MSSIGDTLDAGGSGIISPMRSIGGITANVTIEEIGEDASEITEHPVEKTAEISDHAYPLAAMLRVRIGFSPSGSAVGGVSPSLGDAAPLQTTYEQFLAMKTGRKLLQVQTGKRLYENMLIKTIVLVNNPDTEYGLFLSMDLKEIILAETQTVTVPPNNVQKTPAKTGNVLDAGTKQAKPSPATYNANGGP